MTIPIDDIAWWIVFRIPAEHDDGEGVSQDPRHTDTAQQDTLQVQYVEDGWLYETYLNIIPKVF